MALAFFLGVFSASAQEAEMEDIFENLGEETSSSPDLDAIERFASRPLNLRRAAARDLTAIPGFSLPLARRVLRIARTLPDSARLSDIADSLHLSPEQRYLLEHCAALGEFEEKAKQGNSATWRARSALRFQQPKGFRSGVYQGSDIDAYQRLQLNFKDISGGILTNKDAGESSFGDFASAFAEARYGNFRGIAGDFTVSSGMGGILWRQFGLRKGAEVISPANQYGFGVAPSRSSLDFGFFRGAAAEYKSAVGDSAIIALTAFGSSIRRSAFIDSSGTAISLKTDGFFRSASDELRRNTLPETAIGATAEYRSQSLTVTFAALGLRYEFPIASVASAAFSGRKGILLSVSGQWLPTEAMAVSGEISRDAQGNYGGRASLLLSGKSLAATISGRMYSAEFRSPYGYSFGEFSAPGNEYGLYASAEWRGKMMQILGYADIYGSRRPRYGMTRPSRGMDVLLESRSKIASETSALLRVRVEQKNDAFSTPEARADYTVERFSVRAECQRSITKTLSLRLRTEVVHVDFHGAQPSESGAVGFGEMRWQASEWLQLAGRIAFFSTDSYASARWTFEYALPGMMSNPALYGSGSRSFIMAAISPMRLLTARVLYTATAKNGVTSLGAGFEEIEGAADSRITFQIDAAW